MADLNDLQAAQTVKIAGSNSSGVEDNFASVAANQNLKVQDGLKDGGVQGNLNLVTGGTSYEAKVGLAKLVGRKSLAITALDDMYWGYTSAVTTSSGTPLYKNQQIVFAVDSDSPFEIWLVASANNKNARIAESP
jgi:hypothetical protein